MKFEDISSREDFEEFFCRQRDFGYIDEETLWVDKEHKAKYYIVDNLNSQEAYRLFRKKKGVEMTPYYIFVDSSFNAYYIFSEYHTPFRFVYDKNRREREYTKKSRLQLLNALRYEDKSYNDSFQALFDTKPLVKKFYEEYKNIKIRLSAALKGLTEDEKWLYSQILLDRIIFIYFLQSKGVIKQDYLSNLFNNRDSKKNFYKSYLNPLFFNAFNTEHKFYEKIIVDGVDLGHIPYLNGGLFSKKDIEKENDISIPDKIWGEIFEHFDTYEWVIEEQKEDAVVLTPSILGHIFEQSITGRKGKGAYYTPSEITEYISMNTIYPYITDRLNERFRSDYTDITRQLLNKEKHSPPEINRVAYLYFNILKELRVLDNACGSGAFLMAAHRILLALYRKCYRILKDELVFSAENDRIRRYGSSDYYFKRLIATNNIYGVDLEEGAVEIAKLRLWLSMISDLSIQNIEPLPNIDYNIMHGNTLIGFVEAPLIEQTTLDSQDTTKQIIKAKGQLLKDYKDTTDPETAERLRGDIERINEKFRGELNEKFHRFLTVEHKIDITMEELESLHPFHWGFEFYEIFEKGGFDVTLGNPPWDIVKPSEKEFFSKYDGRLTKYGVDKKTAKIIIEKLLKDEHIEKEWNKHKRLIKIQSDYFKNSDRFTYQSDIIDGRRVGGDLNLYKLFLEQFYRLARKVGYVGVVIPSGFYTDAGSKGLRKMVFDNAKVSGLFCFENREGIFDGIHRSFKFIVLVFGRSGTTKKFEAAFMQRKSEILNNSRKVSISVDWGLIKKLSPTSHSVIEFKNSRDVEIVKKLYRFPLLWEKIEGSWNLKLTRELDMTLDSGLFNTNQKGLILYEGKMIEQFTNTFEPPRYWIEEARGYAKLGNRDYKEYRLGFRSVASSTNRRSLIATILPKNVFCGNSLIITKIFENGKRLINEKELLFLCAVFNSFSLDYLLRQKITTNLNMFYIYELPVPRLTEGNQDFDKIVELAGKLICVGPEFKDLRNKLGIEGVVDKNERTNIQAELDILVSKLYGLETEELEYITSQFDVQNPSAKLELDNLKGAIFDKIKAHPWVKTVEET